MAAFLCVIERRPARTWTGIGTGTRAESQGRTADGLEIDGVAWLQDFYEKECWQHHPKPYADFMEWRLTEDRRLEEERKKTIRI